MVIFLCRDSLEGILCGVYDAWMSRLGHDNVKLQLDSEYNYEMFAEYRKAEITEAKTEKVIRSIRSKISEDAYRYVYRAALSEEKGKADLIYRFLIYGFHLSADVNIISRQPNTRCCRQDKKYYPNGFCGTSFSSSHISSALLPQLRRKQALHNA